LGGPRKWKGEVYERYEQPDGKLILGGRFFMNDFPDTVKAVRVLLDGSLDPSFNNLVDYRTGTFALSAMASGVNVFEPLADGRILVGGLFTHVDGGPRGSIACVDTLGNLLDCWAGGGLVPQGYAPSGFPFFGLAGFKCLPNGDCYIYGAYKGFIDANGLHPRQCIMSRIIVPSTGIAQQNGFTTHLKVWPNPGSEFLFVDWPRKVLKDLEMRDALGRLVLWRGSVLNNTAIDVSELNAGTYTVHARGGQGERAVTKWMKP